MQDKIRFGPAGNSDAFYEEGHKHTYEAPKWLAAMGLSAFEYSFGRGAKLKQETGEKIAGEAEKYGVQMSVHAPYYINLANEKFEDNLRYFMESSLGARYLSADRVVFHPGAKGKLERETAASLVKKNLQDILAALKSEGYADILYCAETMGKINQIGDLEEVCAFANLGENVYPAIDFGHLNARTLGGIKSREDYAKILDTLKNKVGEEKYKNMHVHFSQIQYTNSGEKMHLTFTDAEWGPFFGPLAELFAERGLTPRIICESKGTQAMDAVAMKEMYEAAL
ncbi:MAG: TIM barrel protein [Christensenellaceae bacterium]|jgi:deoxyribonuclease-4